MPSPQITYKDERTIEFRQGLDATQVEQVGKFIVNAGQDGYVLNKVETIKSGDQRDPYTVGTRLTFYKAQR